MDHEDDEPSVAEPIESECGYCGCTFPGTGDDCGACPLDDEQCADYAKRRSPQGWERTD